MTDLSDLQFPEYLQSTRQRINSVLDACLPEADPLAPRLAQAMRYSVLNGGKRVRATLVYAAADVFEPALDPSLQDQVACAIECIHAYSLVHDDLPAMDDDDLRRGQPTCHIAFDEATAILAGDALQTFAFELLTNLETDADRRLCLIKTLASASGHQGMVLGQALDIEAENQSLPASRLAHMHLHKTGKLIQAAVAMGGILAGADQSSLDQLDTYAGAIGLAFQVQDDILDVEGNTDELGKTSGADEAMNKSTYVAALGLEGARDKAQQLHREAIESLADFGPSAERLRQLSAFIIERNR